MDQETVQVFDRWHQDSSMASHTLGFERRPDGQYGCPHPWGEQHTIDVAAGHFENQVGDQVWVRCSTVALVCSMCWILYREDRGKARTMIEQRSTEQQSPAKVASVPDEHCIVVNRGWNDNVQVGMTVLVGEVTEIQDPDTQEHLGRVDRRRTLQVEKVWARMAFCRDRHGARHLGFIKVGDPVEVIGHVPPPVPPPPPDLPWLDPEDVGFWNKISPWIMIALIAVVSALIVVDLMVKYSP